MRRILGLALSLLSLVGCGPAVPRPVAPDTACQGGDHEVVLWDGGVGVCPDDPTGYTTGPVSNFRRVPRRPARVRR